jgi:hypothetical protein
MSMPRLVFLGLLLACGLPSCSPDGAPVAEAQYAAKIVGNWQGTVGDTNETISFAADGGFVSQVRPRGFISNTLGQGVTGVQAERACRQKRQRRHFNVRTGALIFASPRRLDFPGSLKQAPGRTNSKHYAQERAKREVECARIKQRLKGVTHIHFFLPSSIHSRSLYVTQRIWELMISWTRWTPGSARNGR